jgi:hypothetical protein
MFTRTKRIADSFPAQKGVGIMSWKYYSIVCAFGPRLTAVVALLSGRYRLSHREVRQLVTDLWAVVRGYAWAIDFLRRVRRSLCWFPPAPDHPGWPLLMAPSLTPELCGACLTRSHHAG